jgi:multiple sugar transport system ATP-binding protein
MTELVRFRGISKSFNGNPALRDIDFVVEGNSFTVLCGPPRAGKSVLLRALIGLDTPDRGQIIVAGEDITRRPPAARRIGYVPQSFALYPHFTVYDNIAYPLRLQHAPAAEIRERVARAAEILGITHLLEKAPDQLSGGEKQRTAVARGLLKNAEIFILDDPLVGLDFKLREKLMEDLQSMRRDLGATFIYATADSLEALTMAERLVVLDEGRVIEAGTVETMYREPGHARTMEVVGFPRANLVDGVLGADGLCTTGLFSFRLAAEGGLPPPCAVRVGIRPEAMRPGAAMTGSLECKGTVDVVEDLGAEDVVHLSTAVGTLVTVFPAGAGPQPTLDEEIALSVAPADLIVFDAASGARLGRGAERGDA